MICDEAKTRDANSSLSSFRHLHLHLLSRRASSAMLSRVPWFQISSPRARYRRST